MIECDHEVAEQEPDHCIKCGAPTAMQIGQAVHEEAERLLNGQSRVDYLLSRGAEQVSRKHRHVAVLPKGMTGLEALEKFDPDQFERTSSDTWSSGRQTRIDAAVQLDGTGISSC